MFEGAEEGYGEGIGVCVMRQGVIGGKVVAVAAREVGAAAAGEV